MASQDYRPMYFPRSLFLATTTVVTLVACDPVALPDTVEATVRHAIDGLARDNDPGVIWDLLPASYQSDVRAWCHQLAGKLPQDGYQKTLKVVRRFGSVLKQRSDFLAANMPLKVMLQAVGNVGEDDLAAACAASGDVFLILSKSDLQTLQGLATLDPGTFLHGAGRRIGRSAMRAARITGRDPIASAQGTVVEVLAATETSASIRIRVEGQNLTLEFQRAEGRWVPAGMASNWRRMDASVRAWVKDLDLKPSSAYLKILDEVLMDLEKLEETQSRSQFERLLMESITKYKKLLESPR